MGLYSNSRYSTLGSVNVPANESYNDITGAYDIMIESAQEEHAIFEEVIKNDFMEAYGYVNEGAIGDFFEGIKKFILKVIAKIKGLFKAFMVKIMSLTGNGKKLVKEYKKYVIGGNYSEMKFKWRKDKKDALTLKISESNVLDKFNEILKETVHAELHYATINNVEGGNLNKYDNNKTFDNTSKSDTLLAYKSLSYTNKNKAGDDLEKYIDEPDYFREAVYENISGVKVDASSWDKDILDSWFEDVEEYEGFSGSGVSETDIIRILEDGKYVSNAKKNVDAIIKAEDKMVAQLDKAAFEISKATKIERHASKAYVANAFSTLVHIHQGCVSNFTGLYLREIKKRWAEYKALFAKCYAHVTVGKGTPKTEATEYEDFMYEAALYEAESDLGLI